MVLFGDILSVEAVAGVSHQIILGVWISRGRIYVWSIIRLLPDFDNKGHISGFAFGQPLYMLLAFVTPFFIYFQLALST